MTATRIRDYDLCDCCRLPKRRTRYYYRVHIVSDQEVLAVQLCAECWTRWIPAEYSRRVREVAQKWGELTK